MKILNKFCAFAVIVFLAFSISVGLTACSKDDGKLNIVCTIFPIYDWIREVAGENMSSFNVTLLLENGADMHSFSPSMSDGVKIAEADILIYVGGESDEWIGDMIKNFSEKSVAISLIEVLSNYEDALLNEEEGKGMQVDLDEEEGEVDEHVWLSLKNAEIFVGEITKVLKRFDQQNAQKYESNMKSYLNKLSSLDSYYTFTVKNSSMQTPTIIVGDRFPYRYLFSDYNIDYYAAFSGCSTETNASVQTIINLAKAVDDLRANVIIVVENSDQNIAKQIREVTVSKDQEILTLNSVQSVTKQQIDSGVTYLSVMRDNLFVLAQSLNFNGVK